MPKSPYSISKKLDNRWYLFLLMFQEQKDKLNKAELPKMTGR
jgi:hypothetical protein